MAAPSGSGLQLPLPGALEAPRLRATGGAAARSARCVPFAASEAENALGSHVGKTKPGAPSAPQLWSPRPDESGGASWASARRPRAAERRRSSRPRPPEETRGLPNSGCRPLPTLPSSVSPLPIPAGPLGTSPAARPERGSARPLRGCAAAASRRSRAPRAGGEGAAGSPPPPAPRPRSPSAHAASPRRSGGPPHPGSASCPVRGAPSLATILPRAGRAAAAADAQRAKSRGSSRRLSRGSRLECRLRAETQPGGRDGGDPRIRYSVRWEFCSWQRFFCRLKPVTVGHCRSRSFTAGLRAAGARI